MKTTYIQFDAPKSNNQTAQNKLVKHWPKKILASILKTFIPKANPNFDDKINEVRYWLIECDSETGIPEREIGLDKEKHILVKMPNPNNYGYWTDNSLLLNDFKKHFVVSQISKEHFEQNWRATSNQI